MDNAPTTANHQQPNLVIEMTANGPEVRYAGSDTETASAIYATLEHATFQRREATATGSRLISSDRK